MTVFTVQLPAPGTLFDFTERVELDGVLFDLRFRWNQEADTWFMDVFAADGTTLVLSRRASIDWTALRQNRYQTTIPAGEFIFFDSTQRDTAPGERDLGDRVQVLYLDASEVAG